MRILGRLRRWINRIMPTPRAMILAYHRIADVELDPQLLCVSPGHFSEQLEVLRRHYRPMGLRDLRRRLRLNRWWPRTVVVTFDDGYADNLHEAKPRLDSADVPATVFVTAGQVDRTREAWWDELESVLLTDRGLAGELDLTIAGRVHHWHLPGDCGATAVLGRWHVLMNDIEPTPRQALYLDLARLLRGLPHEDRELVLDRLSEWAGRTRVARSTHRALGTEELRALAQGGLVEVGAHTLTHPVLSLAPPAVQRQEIAGSKRLLEDKLGFPVTSFAYPFGGRADYGADTVKIVKNAGFDCACSNFEGPVTLLTDPYQLPRFLVRDWDGDLFARHLEVWLSR